jgi:prephenate dehydrogenase
MPKVSIIGLGLIGGSIGLALKRVATPDVMVVGYDRDARVAQRARTAGAVQQELPQIDQVIDGADLIIVATPIVNMRSVFEEMAPYLKPGMIVTDTASTKADVLRWARAILPAGVHFVGGHPMAGKESSGPQAAEETLFDGRSYCIIPAVDAGGGAVRTVVGLAQALGARPFFLDAEEHDAYAAAISHLPLVTSLALFNLIRESTSWPELATMAGPAFRDLTRLASGSPEMSHDIFLTNRSNVLHWIERYIAELQRLQDMIESDDSESLYRMLAETQMERDTFIMNPPRRVEAEPPDVELPTASESFLNAMAGTLWRQRSKDMLEGMEERAREREREDRLRRRT